MKANDTTVAGLHLSVGDLDDIDERKVAELSARISRREYAPDGDDVARKLLSELLGELLL
jgi:anti-sigma28 factor (negative regulator of flagellin synthesis)